uniref:Armadillo repeat containing 2 n=1 Tax=Salvator merianae TaxID=96440 RepID=A0A8D0C4D3_SALMN
MVLYVSEYNWGINETEKEEKYWDMKILPLLRELESEDNVERLCHTCTIIYQALKEGNMLGKRFKKRTLFLKTLYKLVDIPSDLLGLKLAKIILGLKVSGKNLLNVCKLVFKISRNEKNDFLIQNDELIDSLLEILRAEDLQANTEAFLYCMGALKFMSGNSRLINEMVSKGTVEVVLQLLKQINEINENDAQFSSSGHILVQLMATLRNLVDLPQPRCKLLDHGAIPDLCLLLEKYMNDKDVCTNVARIFSKLSSFNDCCAALADCSRCYILFLALLNKHPKKQVSFFISCFLYFNPLMCLWCCMCVSPFSVTYVSLNTFFSIVLLKLLMSSNMDGILEAIRVFGNLSQYPEICDFIIQRKVYKFMIALLDAKHQDVCFSACGVLLNLTVDKSRRQVLSEEGGIKKLIDCLRDFAPTDWQLACLICKTLWNYSENISSAESCFREDESNALSFLLASFLDEEVALGYNLDSDLRDYHKLYWETEFRPVAQKLLQRIKIHHTHPNRLAVP